MNQSQGFRSSPFVQSDARFYKEVYRENKNVQQMLSGSKFNIISGESPEKSRCPDESASPLKNNNSYYNFAGSSVAVADASPCKKRLGGNGQGSRMLESQFQMFPDAKDRSEALNP